MLRHITLSTFLTHEENSGGRRIKKIPWKFWENMHLSPYFFKNIVLRGAVLSADLSLRNLVLINLLYLSMVHRRKSQCWNSNLSEKPCIISSRKYLGFNFHTLFLDGCDKCLLETNAQFAVIHVIDSSGKVC